MTLSDEELKASRVSTDINETVLRDAQTTCPCMLGDTGSSWSHPNTPRKLKKYRNHKHARPRSSAGADRKQSLAKASGPGKSDASPRPKHSKSCQLRIVHDASPLEPVVFLPAEEFTVERVFPIRSLVGERTTNPDSSTQTSTSTSRHSSFAARNEPDSADIGPFPNDSQGVGGSDAPSRVATDAASPAADESDPFLPPPWPPIPPEDAIRRLYPQPEADADTATSSGDEGIAMRRISERVQMVPSRFGPPGIAPGIPVTNAHKKKFYRCEDEPIHTPGAIQQFGALIVLKYNKLGDLEVRIASENTYKILNHTAEQLFSIRSFLDLLGTDVREDFVARVTHALNAGRQQSKDTHLDIFTMSIVAHSGLINLWCAIHIANGTEDLVVCEFEDYSEVLYADAEHEATTLPKVPTRTIDNEILPEERHKSTTSSASPLRVLQIAKQRGKQTVGAMEIFNGMIQAQQQLASATSVQNVLDIVVGLISELTGFHRVMFYRFDTHKNGVVDAELLNPRASEDLFRGLHFPASDIPKQARDLYKINRIRILYDRDEETARLICRDMTDFETPLDLTHSYLRAISPIHLKYLANMGVRSSMSVSIVMNDDLWGLIACHGYGDRGIRVTLPIRELCRNIGECASTNIERLLMAQRINARKPPRTAPPTQTPSGFIAASSTDLLTVFDADFGLLSIQDEARAIGRLDPYREALAVLAHLQACRFTDIKSSQNIAADFPTLNYAPGIKTIAGLLVIPLSIGGTDFLVFFRKGQLREVRWAGNPYEKIKRAGSQYLEPRSSFRRWTETIKDMSTEWTDDHLETASVLSLLYGRFIEIWRQKESAGQNNRMTRLLIRNTSHEVRTPLNAIVNYLEMALENKIDEATRDLLARAHKASRSLVYVIDDLLNLTKAENGPVSLLEDTFDLSATVSEVVIAFRKEALRKNLNLTIATHKGIPEMVKGDSSRLRQVLSNLTSNAFQHSQTGGVKVDIRPIVIKPTRSIISITIQDLGQGMSEEQLDDLFQEFEQILDEDHGLGRPRETRQPPEPFRETIGLGLAVVARYVRNMNGQIRVHSAEGKGTIFGIELPFEHAISPPDATDSGSDGISSSFPGLVIASEISSVTILSDTPASTPIEELSVAHYPNTSVSGSHLIGASSTVSPPLNSPYTTFPFPGMASKEPLSILIAEDNPINAKLLHRRLQKLGHRIEIAYDGQACHDQYADHPLEFDAILMDIQMPLVDGAMSTRMIRHYEKTLQGTSTILPRVPIIAVSASLNESNRFDYVESGFDAWILKPIDFNRLDFLLEGIKKPDIRRLASYVPGKWGIGGWFLP